MSIFLYTGYGDKRTIARRIAKMEAWLRDPQLLEGSHHNDHHYHHYHYHHHQNIIAEINIIMIFSIADAGATYAAEIHINLEDIKVRKQIICRRNAPSLS